MRCPNDRRRDHLAVLAAVGRFLGQWHGKLQPQQPPVQVGRRTTQRNDVELGGVLVMSDVGIMTMRVMMSHFFVGAVPVGRIHATSVGVRNPLRNQPPRQHQGGEQQVQRFVPKVVSSHRATADFRRESGTGNDKSSRPYE